MLVSGDVYDRALPPVDAVALCDDALRRLAGTGARVVLISGNHDSARRLGFGAGLIDAAGVHLRTDAAAVGTGRCCSSDRRTAPVAVYARPLPRARRRARRARLRRAASHAAVLGAAMDRVRADLAGRAAAPARSCWRTPSWPAAQASESERDISVGGVASVPPAGLRRRRLRRARPPARRPAARRPGPLQRLAAGLLVLRGAPHARRCWLVELGAARALGAASTAVPTPVHRPLARVARAARRPARPTDALGALRGALPAGDADRPEPPARADGAAARAGSRTSWCSPSSPTARRRRPAPSYAEPAARPQRPRDRRPTSSTHVRGAGRRRPRSALLPRRSRRVRAAEAAG